MAKMAITDHVSPTEIDRCERFGRLFGRYSAKASLINRPAKPSAFGKAVADVAGQMMRERGRPEIEVTICTLIIETAISEEAVRSLVLWDLPSGQA